MSPITLEEWCSTDFSVPECTHYYLYLESHDGPSLLTYRRIANAESCEPSKVRNCEGRPSYERVPKPTPPDKADDFAIVTFANEFEAQEHMLSLDCLTRLLQTWPWSPVSVATHRQKQWERAEQMGAVSWRCHCDCVFDSDALMDILGRRETVGVALKYRTTTFDMDAVVAASQVLGLELEGGRNTDVARLSGMKRLKYLSLRRSWISDAFAGIFSDLPELRSLDISRTQVTDRFFEESDIVGRVGDLSIGETQVTNVSGRVRNAINATRILDCSRTMVGDEFFTANSTSWANIITLNVAQTQIGDRAVRFFAECQSLFELHLDFCNVTWDSLQRFCGNSNLTRLSLRGVRISVNEYRTLRENMPQCLVSM